MSRINPNVNSLIAQRVLKGNNQKLSTSLTRLSTGLKINTGADNPAGLIASENLRAEKTGIQAAMSNAQRAGNIVATAEGGLAEVSSLLNEIQGLVNETANSGGLSQEEVEANQLQIDSILATINRLAGSVTFQGKKLLNGELGYTTSGTNLSAVSNLHVHSARLPEGATQNVTIAVTGSAQTGVATYTSAGAHTANFTLEIGGKYGTDKASLGISSVSTGSLGLDGSFLSSLANGGANSLTGDNLVTAQRVIDAAVKQVSQTRGRLGAFQKFVINSTVNQLGVAYENASAAESAIRDTDFAAETAQLTRAQILAQASTNVLAQANAQPQLALQLLA